ncbi:putative transcription regulator BDF1 [Aspergillus candidus]|uniref:Bromodomain-containing protein n=1 Tax=Aspergillus candidus TaxID=41067 RepID=A0A2I2FCB5_ASPCN|nr:Bromodomain-containing protein [Aspergillus candidus]PLB38237.1 Bromodomain-containing protein [Aspergillus candidus]
MATPPPEAPSVLKEEKPQLPPSPNGASDDATGKGGQDSITDAKPDAGTNGDQKPTEASSPVNGQLPEKASFTNGANMTTSPPKSPAATAADTPTQPAAPTKEVEPSNSDTPATEDAKGKFDDKPAAGGLDTQENANAASEAASTDQHPSQDDSKPTPTEGNTTQVEDASTVKTALPHHPPTVAQPGGISHEGTPGTPSNDAAVAAPQQSTDQEMRDAPEVPASPTKVSREREPEPSDEPAAKRTKIGGEDTAPTEFKVPTLPTPTAEGPASSTVNGRDGMTKVQHKFLLKGIQSLKRMNDARFYRDPVDPIKLNIPHYPTIIKQPMDLGTIERKLKANEYKTVQGVVDDFNLMVQNAVTFNSADHLVSKEGERLKGTFEKQMVNLPKATEVEEKKPKKLSTKTSAARREPRTSTGSQPASRVSESSPQTTTFALGPEGLPLIRRDSTTVDGRPKRSIHPPKRDLPYSTKPKKKKYQWELKFCQEVLDDLYKPKHYLYASPFYAPVDPVALNIPTYHSIIKKPMDLSTVQSKLKTGQYENAKEFETDVRQIFKNCYKFNIPGDPTYLAGQKFEEVFNAKWSQKGRYLEAHEPHPEPHSASSSEDESEDEAEESDVYDDEKLTMLQKQIAEMSRQVDAITQKKKKTPPRSKKAGKTTKSGKKESKKSSSVTVGKKDKKISSKSSKPEKERWITYGEKQIISNGISSLPDKKMQEALRIIQSNVPALKGTQETEIELDIDELPNDVLMMLLRFVKKNAPHVMEDEEVQTPIAQQPAPPKPKKNKPMSKYEQEAQINMLESNLSRFQGGGGRSPDPVPSVEANESSDDSDDDSEESEEE